MADEQFDVAVVGLGAMGSATAYQLARDGARVVGLDRFAPPHAMGSSHGETRITRQAVGEGRDYAPFVLAAHEIWRELEAATGEALLTTCGALVLGAGGHHGRADFVTETLAVAEEFGIDHQVLDGAEVARRFPQFNAPAHERAYFEPGGGYLRPERCVAVQLQQAADLGADLRTGVEVRSLEQDAAGVRVGTATGTVRADRAVVCAGAWTGPLLGPPFDALLTVSRQLLHWFALEEPRPAGAEEPVYVWMHGPGEADYFYGFPPLAGDPSVKVATEQYSTSTTAPAADRTVHPGESARMHAAHLAGRLRGVSDRAVRAAACLYTVTPDRGFVIDRHPELERVIVVSACSGHGFKHSAGVGAAVAQLVTRGRSDVDLAPFGLARFR